MHSGNPSHGDCAPHLARRSRRAIAQVASSGARQARSISPISRWQLVLDTQIMRDLATASLQLCAERLSFSGEAACVLDTSNALLARNPSREICEMPKLCSLPTVYRRISAFQSNSRLPREVHIDRSHFLLAPNGERSLVVHRRLAVLSFRIWTTRCLTNWHVSYLPNQRNSEASHLGQGLKLREVSFGLGRGVLSGCRVWRYRPWLPLLWPCAHRPRARTK